MAQIIDSDPYSNEYFFITGFSEVFGAGKNSFVVNCTKKILVGQELNVTAYDPDGNSLAVTEIETPGPEGIELPEFNEVYIVSVPESTPNGVGHLEINATGIDTGIYTGSISYFKGKAYPVNKDTRLPLVQAPNSSPFPEIDVKWSRNILIDTVNSTTSQVRFFDLPYIDVTPQLYNYTLYPTGSYRLASGSCFSIAVKPKNNGNGNFDYYKDKPLYQLYANDNHSFSGSMEGEKIRIKNPYVKNFTYANYSNNQITFEGVLNTDFIATIEKVINSSSLLIDIPFSTVSDLVNRVNEDSVYNKNNLVNIFGYNVNDDPAKQTVYKKNNFYILSIANADYEIFYKEIPDNVSTESSSTVRSLLNIEFQNLRTYCGKIESYKIYGQSLNTPEYRILLCEGKVAGEELIISKNFTSGLYNNAGKFYSQAYTDRFWLTSGAVIFNQNHAGYINGATIGNVNLAGANDYVIFKDDTTGMSRTPAYINYNLVDKSYWYANADAFINSYTIPSSSYEAAAAIPELAGFENSMENLLTGSIHDSNPILLRHSTLYEFSMNIRPFSNNTSDSVLHVYFLSGNDIKLIGNIDNTFRFGSNEVYSYTFFSDINKFGTIKLVPSAGQWHISNLSLTPYSYVDYSIDSFAVKVPLRPLVTNELYNIEAELYDAGGNLAYGDGSYSFKNNLLFKPLKKQVFVDPRGTVSELWLDGGSSTT